MAQAPEVTRATIKKRPVKVRAHTRQVAQNPKAAAGDVAAGQRYAALGRDIATKQYAAKPLAARKQSLLAARTAGPQQRTRTQRVFLDTHGQRVSPAGQGRGALARRFDTAAAGDAFARAHKVGKTAAPKPPPITGQTIIQSKLKTNAAEAAQLRASLKNAKHTFLDRSVTNVTAFAMKNLTRVSTGIGSEVLGKITEPSSNILGGEKQNSFAEGFKHPEKHAADWDHAVEAAGIHNKLLRGAVALTASIVTDPTTYVAFGTGTLAKEAGAQAARDALKSGANLTDALRAGRHAAASTGEAGQRKGIQVGLRGGPARLTGKRQIMTRPLGGPTRQAVVEAGRKAGIKHTGGAIGRDVHEAVRQAVMNPNVKPRGWEEYEYEIARQAGTAGRAAERTANRNSDALKHWLAKSTKDWTDDQHLAVHKALESNDHSKLGPAERPVAAELTRLRDMWYNKEPGRAPLGPNARVGFADAPTTPTFKHTVTDAEIQAARANVRTATDVKAATRDRDLLIGERSRQRKVIRDFTKDMQAYHAAPEGYSPRVLKPEMLTGESHARPTGRGPAIGNSQSYHGRKAPIALENMTSDQLDKYDFNLVTGFGRRSLEHGRINAAAQQHEWMAGMGDPVNMRPSETGALAGNRDRRLFSRDEMGIHPLYNTETGEVDVARLRNALINGHEVSEVDPSKYQTIQNLIKGGQRGHEVDPADLLRRGPEETRENWMKRTQRSWKWWATAPNPSYHLRNAVGDTFNALIAGTQMNDFRHAIQMNRADYALKKLEMSLDTPEGKHAMEVLRQAAGRTEHYPGIGTDLSDLEVMGLANKYGAINSGIISGELERFQHMSEGPVVDALHLAPVRDSIQRVGDYRENIARLATFRNGLKRGMSPSEAAQYSLKHHIDYSNLSRAEVGFWRYAVPFWTWWSRNLPLQVGGMLKNPGLYANTEKARRQSLITAGVDPNIAESMGDTDQENLPWGTPFSSKSSDGKRVPIVAGPGLSYMDLGSIPYPHTDVTTTMQNTMQDWYGRINPALKLGIEEGTGVNPYTFQQHEQFNKGKYLPAPAWLPEGFPGVKMKYNDKTGQFEKMANWRLLSAVNTIPVANRLGKVMAPEPQPGKPGASQAIAGWLTGPKYTPIDERQLRINQLYDRTRRIDSWLTEHKGDYSHVAGEKWAGPVGAKLKQKSKLAKEINGLKREMGFKNVKKIGRPKGKKSHPFGTAGGGTGVFGGQGGSSGTFGAGG